MNGQLQSIPIIIAPHDWYELCNIMSRYLPEYDVWAFGSRVTGTAKPFSDLDLLIRTELPLTFEKMATLKDAFDESDLTIRVDLVDWAATSTLFRDIILQHYVVLQRAQTV
jgi:predicted nucleotidyltransferase